MGTAGGASGSWLGVGATAWTGRRWRWALRSCAGSRGVRTWCSGRACWWWCRILGMRGSPAHQVDDGAEDCEDDEDGDQRVLVHWFWGYLGCGMRARACLGAPICRGEIVTGGPDERHMRLRRSVVGTRHQGQRASLRGSAQPRRRSDRLHAVHAHAGQLVGRTPIPRVRGFLGGCQS